MLFTEQSLAKRGENARKEGRGGGRKKRGHALWKCASSVLFDCILQWDRTIIIIIIIIIIRLVKLCTNMVEITAFYELQQRARRKTQPRDDFHLHVWNVLNTYRSTGSPTSLTSLLSIHKNGRKLWDMFSQPRSSLSCSFCPTNSPHVALLQLFWQIEQCGRWRTPPARNTSEVKPCITREMEAVISTFFFFFFLRELYICMFFWILFFFFCCHTHGWRGSNFS